MKNPFGPRKTPLFLERLAKAGYILDVECSKREIRITYNRNASKYTTIPFGKTRLTDFQGVIYMGRTVPSFCMLLERILMELSTFRRALMGEDRNAFDSLMNKARQHASSCTVAPLLDPMDAVFLSILVEQQKEISSLQKVLSTDGRSIISDASKEQLLEDPPV